ncbi:MAG: hypothetical protein ACFFED_16640 [Candidatus Thorarchaeota archaeon]
MIRNLIILDHAGNNLLSANFGECHSLGTSSEHIGGFVSAIYSFSQTIIGQEIRNIRFAHLDFLILSKSDIIFMISADDGGSHDNRRKLERISSLFIERYKDEVSQLKNTTNSPDFREFIDYLHELDITQQNCGNRPACQDCPDHRVLPLDEISKTLQKGTVS